MTHRIILIEGSITDQRVDAIVNAANNSLLGGGGVDGAIHRAAGPMLAEECRLLGGCPTGKAKITKGYNLLASWVIHAVGPVWQGGNNQEDALLAECYQNCFALTVLHRLRSIAFPAIGTGAYGFPLHRATRIALGETRTALKENSLLEKVVFVCFNKKTHDVYRDVLSETF